MARHRPEVEVYDVNGSFDVNLFYDGYTIRPVRVEPEAAWRVVERPQAEVRATSWRSLPGVRMPTRWAIGVRGFIETEALDAYQKALEDLWGKVNELPVEQWPSWQAVSYRDFGS